VHSPSLSAINKRLLSFCCDNIETTVDVATYGQQIDRPSSPVVHTQHPALYTVRWAIGVAEFVASAETCTYYTVELLLLPFLTSPQSNLRRARRKSTIDSDDSQVQDRPSPGKPSLRYSPSTRISNYSANTALVC